MSWLLFGGLLAAARWSYLHILPHHGLQQEPPQRQPSHAVDITARIGRRQVLCGCYITRAVTRLAVLDIVPTWHVLGNVTRALAAAFYYWFFLAAGNGIPGHMIAAAPPYWFRSLIGRADGLLRPGTGYLAAQHHHLMAQHHDLRGGRLGARTSDGGSPPGVARCVVMRVSGRCGRRSSWRPGRRGAGMTAAGAGPRRTGLARLRGLRVSTAGRR